MSCCIFPLIGQKKKRKERQKRNWKASEASIETDKCITIVLLKYEHQMAWGCDWWLELDNYCKLSLNPWGLRETVIWSMNLLSMTPMQSTFFSRIVGYKEYFLRAKPRVRRKKNSKFSKWQKILTRFWRVFCNNWTRGYVSLVDFPMFYENKDTRAFGSSDSWGLVKLRFSSS